MIGTIGELAGLQVLQSRLVPADRIIVAGRHVLVADVPYFLYRVRMDAIKAQMRRDLQVLLDQFAARWGIDQ